MKTDYLRKIISDNDYKVDYGDTDNLHNLPNYIKLYHDCKAYYINIELFENSDEIFCEIWIKEDKVELTDNQLDYIYNTFSDLLNEKIHHCKMLFYEHGFNDIY
tara:strand:+ start:277 stop:588 length:312 start_codon:yes stop_codon:yes gene_type:complete